MSEHIVKTHVSNILAIDRDRITRIYSIRDPHKLARLGEPAQLTR